jgi:hypothetical protein
MPSRVDQEHGHYGSTVGSELSTRPPSESEAQGDDDIEFIGFEETVVYLRTVIPVPTSPVMAPVEAMTVANGACTADLQTQPLSSLKRQFVDTEGHPDAVVRNQRRRLEPPEPHFGKDSTTVIMASTPQKGHTLIPPPQFTDQSEIPSGSPDVPQELNDTVATSPIPTNTPIPLPQFTNQSEIPSGSPDVPQELNDTVATSPIPTNTPIPQTTAGPQSGKRNWATKTTITVNPDSDISTNNFKGKNGKGQSGKGKNGKGKNRKGKNRKPKNEKKQNVKQKNIKRKNAERKNIGAEVASDSDDDGIESVEDTEGDSHEREMDTEGDSHEREMDTEDDDENLCPQLGTGPEELRRWVEDTYSKGRGYKISHPELDVKTFSVCVSFFIGLHTGAHPTYQTHVQHKIVRVWEVHGQDSELQSRRQTFDLEIRGDQKNMVRE